MKVTLDLDLLLAEGSIDQALYDRLRGLSARGTSAVAFNILVAFGVIAVGGATLALLPTTATAIALGLAVCAAGLALTALRLDQWRLLANICVVIGALLFAGGILKLGAGSAGTFFLVAVLLAAAAILARSGLLAVLAILAASSCLGARTGYLHAMYFLGIQAPTLTIVAFTLASVLLYFASKRAPLAYRGLAIAAARTAIFLVNFGFWIGSLWGDRFLPRDVTSLSERTHTIVIADWVFALLWAIALVAAGLFGWKRDRRWLVIVAATFGAIDFYTQWFERLGATPTTVLVAGLIALGLAVALRAFSRRPARA